MSLRKSIRFVLAVLLILSGLAACSGTAAPVTAGPLRVLAVESFLGDIARNVAGDRLQVETLIPLGVDPHEYQPSAQDVARIADSQVLIINGLGYEWWLQKTLDNAGGDRLTVTAADGLTPRPDPSGSHPDGDPHMWLDPNNVIHYVENIRDGLSKADPQGAAVYAANADSYIKQLKLLDQWIVERVSTVNPSHRLLVTNHESLGYFADRYGFTIVGAVIPSFSSDSSPTARDMADLIQQIKQTGATVLLLDVGANPNLAQQIASETGVRVVTDLYIETLSAPDGPAPSYLMMMRHDVDLIVAACAT